MTLEALFYCLTYILVGQSIFWPALIYYLKAMWVRDFPWLVFVFVGAIVTVIPAPYLFGMSNPQLPELSSVMEGFQIKLIITGLILLAFGGGYLRNDKSFIFPFTLSWILILVGGITYALSL